LIRRLAVRGYQSLHRVELEFAKLTVVVGPSSSGKSALLRAIRQIAFNTRGGSWMSHGQTTATIVADTISDNGVNGRVIFQRKGTSAAYGVAVNGETLKFSKLAGEVPEQVRALLPLNTGNFAGQFELPYLLESSGSTIARELGKLTNIDRILSAVREANRRQRAAVAELKVRETDLESIRATAQQYRGLRERIQEAAAANERLSALAKRVTRATDLHSFRTASLARLSETTTPPPSLATLDMLASKHQKLVHARDTRAAIQGEILRAQTLANQLASILSEYRVTLRDSLIQAGVCPTCLQSTTGLEHQS
jgi:DNA repair protein SbcC/Rad50